ncbi:MAG: hypothetical protein ACM3VW_08785 [Bacteroidota bacterium]
MMRVLCLTLLMMWCACAIGQQAPPAAPVDFGAQIAALRVARTLNLRQDQVDQLKPWLQQIIQARDQQKLTLDTLAATAVPAIVNVDRALIAGRKPAAADVNAADRAAREQKAAFAATNRVIDAAVSAAYKLLDAGQARLVESQSQQESRLRNASRAAGGAADRLAEYASAMRRLSPQEYDALRGAMGLRLAELLVSPDDRRYNNAVADVLRILDGVRRMSDAEYAERGAVLSQTIARTLGLPEGASESAQPISYSEFADFIAGKATMDALAVYKPAPPLEVAP